MPDPTETWTVKATLDWVEGYLARKGDENPRLAAQWLLSHVTGLSRIQLYTNFERPLTMDERDVLRGYVARRGKGEPLQYITGQVGFRYITVAVRPGVLIPRPETEVLVSEALALLAPPKRLVAADSLLNEYDGAALMAAQAETAGEADAREGSATPASVSSADAEDAKPLLVADIGTGSGCIACSLAQEHPEVRVFATDLSSEAVALAQENVAALGLRDRVQVLQGNLGEALPAEAIGHLQLVVSNPPYIPSAVMETLAPEVADFEPALALHGGPDGLDIFRPLLAWCADALAPGGSFAFELHEECLDQAAFEARQAGFANVRICLDLAGRPRVLTGTKA
ncbi:MAG: HemK/PrmC family methyltransferase [Coriobacteriia bacterium]|nr:HemK/PrmC family methyltransferase [Coriobacteriia bacterium]